MKVLIIEDEALAQIELKRLLNKCSAEIEVLGCLDSIEESVAWLKHNSAPDLIFMDIQLSDGLSFEIFNKLRVTSPVIFTTAYDEYALQAFKLNSIDYVLKPIEQTDLQASLDKYSRLKAEFARRTSSFTPEQVDYLLNFRKPEYKTRFVSRVGDSLKYIQLAEVAYFFAEDKIVFLVTTRDKKYIIDYTLEQLEPLLDPKQFYRLNRRYIAKIDAITDIEKYFHGRLHITLTPKVEDKILISRDRASKFKEWLGL